MKKYIIYFTLFIIPVISMIILLELFHFLVNMLHYRDSRQIYQVCKYYLLYIDSHLFDMVIIRGSVTNMCQTTACHASAWAVIVSGL